MVKSLDRSSPLPLWAQLEQELWRRLEAGEFDDGAFPTDLELTEAYGVSRHTVREAIRHLNKTGVLTRQRGRGTVVNRSEFEQSLGTLYSLFQSVESAGVEQTSEVLRLEVVTDPVAAANLEVDESTDLVLLERLRMAGGSPLAIDRAWLPHDARGAAAERRLVAHRPLCRTRCGRGTGPQPGLGTTHADRADAGRPGPARPSQGRRRVLPRAPGPARRPGDRVAHHDHPGRPLPLRHRLVSRRSLGAAAHRHLTRRVADAAFDEAVDRSSKRPYIRLI